MATATGAVHFDHGDRTQLARGGGNHGVDHLHLDDTERVGEASATYAYDGAVVRIDVRSRHRASSIGATTATFSEQSALVSAGVRF